MRTRLSTLCYIEKDEKYLMLHRIVKKNDVNKDKWIGVGGHFEDGESPEECVIREVKEETGYTVRVKRFAGLAEEIYTNEQLRQTYPDYTHRIIHFFVAEVCGDQRDPISEKDYQMEDSEWIPISAVVTLPRLCPSRLQPILQDVLRTNQPVYLGTELIDES